MMDMELNCYKDQAVIGISDINATAAHEHAGEIECGICWLKERTLCVVKTLIAVGISYLHNQTVISMV